MSSYKRAEVRAKQAMMSKQRSLLALSSQGHISNKVFQLALFSLVIVLIGAGVALLMQSHIPGQADGVSVIGPPSLPASTINAIFRSLDSPMIGTGDIIVQASRKTQIDDAFALAVWWTETNDGEAGTGRPDGDHNPAGVRSGIGYPVDYGGYTIYPSYSAAIVYWFGMIRNNYVNRGLSTIYAISYPYVGTASSPLWAAKVARLMFQYRGEAPPAALSTPTSIAVSPLVPARHHHKLIRRRPEHDRPFVKKPVQTQPLQTHSVQTQPTEVPSALQYAGWIGLGVLLGVLFLALLAAAIRIMRSKRVVPVPVPERITSHLLPIVPLIPALDTPSTEPLAVWTEPLVAPGGLLKMPVAWTRTESLSAEQSLVAPGGFLKMPVAWPRTENLSAEEFPGQVADSENPQTSSLDSDPRVRRVTLLPTAVPPQEVPAVKELETVGVRSGGLLTRYREMQQVRVTTQDTSLPAAVR